MHLYITRLGSNHMNNNFGERLIKSRKEMKLTLQDVGDAMGVTKAAVSLWQKGTLPRDELRPRLAKALGTTEAYLFYGKNDMESVAGAAVEDSNHSGYTVLAPLEGGNEQMRLSNATFVEANVKSSNARFYRTQDNSMIPILQEDTLLAVDISNKSPKNGALYVVEQTGEYRIAQLYTYPGNRLRLRFANRDEYPEEVYNKDDRLFPTIKGRVFWYAVTLPL